MTPVKWAPTVLFQNKNHVVLIYSHKDRLLQYFVLSYRPIEFLYYFSFNRQNEAILVIFVSTINSNPNWSKKKLIKRVEFPEKLSNISFSLRAMPLCHMYYDYGLKMHAEPAGNGANHIRPRF